MRSCASSCLRRLLAWSLVWLCGLSHADPAFDTGMVALVEWSARFAREVDRRLDVPLADQQRYIELLQQTPTEANVPDLAPQAFVVVDRSPRVQAAFVVLRAQAGGWHWVGAAAV